MMMMMMSKTQGLQEGDSSSVRGRRQIQRSGDGTVKRWTNSDPDMARTDPNRVAVSDADRKTEHTIKAFTRWMCTEKPPENAKYPDTKCSDQNPSPWPWQIFATETLENV